MSNGRPPPEFAAEQAAELQAALANGSSSLFTDGDLQAGRHTFERAYELAEQAGDAPAMAEAALGLAGLWVHEHRKVTGSMLLATRLQQVLPLLDARSSLALRVRIRLAGETDYSRGEHASILAVLSQARAAGDPVPLAEALSVAHHCLLGPDHGTLRRELAAELIKTSFRTGRRSDLLMGLLWQTADSYMAGDPHAGRLLGELRDQLGERNHLAVDPRSGGTSRWRTGPRSWPPGAGSRGRWSFAGGPKTSAPPGASWTLPPVKLRRSASRSRTVRFLSP